MMEIRRRATPFPYAAIVVAALCACNARLAVTGHDGVISGTRPYGAPVVMNATIYGTTSSGGPNCRDPYGAAFDSGCGVLYRITAANRFEQVYAFDGKPLRNPVGALTDGVDGWLYGVASPGTFGSRSAVYRYSPKTGRVEVLHVFAPAETGYLLGVVKNKRGDLYVSGLCNQLCSTLFRIDRSGGVRVVHEFDGQKNSADDPNLFGPLAFDAAGNGYGTAVLPGLRCSIYRVASNGAYSTLYDGSCAGADVPQTPFAGPVGDEMYAFSPVALVAVSRSGARRIVARLKDPSERFAGTPVIEADGSVAGIVARSAGRTCGRIVIIERTGAITTLASFARSSGRCWSAGGPTIVPRMTSDGDGLALATVSGARCGLVPDGGPSPTPEQRSCGSIIRIRKDGSVAFVHDFAQTSPVNDGGSPDVAVLIDIKSRRLTARFRRSMRGHASRPFHVYPSALGLQLVGGNGIVRALGVSGGTTSAAAAIRSEADLENGSDVADVPLDIDRALPRGSYDLRLSRDGRGVIDTLGEPLGIDWPYPHRVWAPGEDDASLRALRRRFVGKRVYAYTEIPAHCTLGNASIDLSVPDARVADISRLPDTILEFDLGDDESHFFALDPIVVSYVDVSSNPLLGSVAAVPAPDQAQAAAADSGAPNSCNEFVGWFADDWHVERTFTVRPKSDHPRWPRAMREAVEAGRPMIGMTHEMIANVWGFPATAGTVTELDALENWTYDRDPRSNYAAHFKNDRVVSLDLPKHGP